MDFELMQSDWRSIEIEDKKFTFKSFFSNTAFKFLIFDSHNFKLFIQCQNEDEISKSFKKLNPGLEAPLSKILSKIKDALVNTEPGKIFSIENATSGAADQASFLYIRMQTKISSVKFNYRFELEPLSNDSVKAQLVFPLLLSHFESQTREAELLKIIQNKDKELEDYRAQGIKLSRNYLKTGLFSIDNFNETLNKKHELAMDHLNNPETSLHTSLSHTIHRACIQKYQLHVKSLEPTIESIPTEQTKTSKPPDDSMYSESEPASESGQHVDSLDEESESERLKTKLNEETTTTKKSKFKNPKKKKLF